MTQERVALRVSSFAGMQNLPLVVAERRGLFEAAGLEITLTLVTSSSAQLAALATGHADLIHTAPDNVINYDTNPTAFNQDPAHAPRAVMLMGGSNGPLTLYGAPGVTSVEALRNLHVGVDNPTSGFALVARDLLARAGLELRRDYHLVAAGGTSARASKLPSGDFAATILYPPFDQLAESTGCQPLARSTDAYTAYASQALAALPVFAATMTATITSYIGALLAALRWIHDPAARERVEELLAGEPAIGLESANPARAYAAFTDPTTGYGALAPLDDAGLAQVIAMRARYGVADVTTLGAPEDYRDLSYYERAVARAPAEASGE